MWGDCQGLGLHGALAVGQSDFWDLIACLEGILSLALIVQIDMGRNAEICKYK